MKMTVNAGRVRDASLGIVRIPAVVGAIGGMALILGSIYFKIEWATWIGVGIFFAAIQLLPRKMIIHTTACPFCGRLVRAVHEIRDDRGDATIDLDKLREHGSVQ